VTGAYLVLTNGTATLGLDSNTHLYYVTLSANANFTCGVGVPAALGGDSPISLITSASWPAGTFGPIYLGPSYPTNPSNGNAIFLGNLSDPTLVLDFLQFGTGFGCQSTFGPATGTTTVVGVKSGPAGAGHQLSNYNGSVSNVTNNQTAVANINTSTMALNVGRGLGTGNIYHVVLLNRAITSAEVTAVFSNALVSR
jgi:hypothetical protein